jgi:hypothetical protein
MQEKKSNVNNVLEEAKIIKLTIIYSEIQKIIIQFLFHAADAKDEEEKMPGAGESKATLLSVLTLN